jgi:hypothetical protein
MSRRTVILGALSGFAATLPMTATMSRLHLALPSVERYPLPPRELAEDLPSLAVGTATATLVYHFLYGAAAGALFGGFSRRRDIPAGAAYGIAVWIASYLGWIPASRRLNAATRHPARRNGLMLMAHLVWGAALTVGLRELERSRAASFSRSTNTEKRLKDRPEGHR